MWWTAENKLLLYQVTHVDGKSRISHHWYYDRGGDEVKSEYPPEWYKFMVAIHDDWAYLTTFDTEEEVAGFRKFPLVELPAFLTAHQEKYKAWIIENTL